MPNAILDVLQQTAPNCQTLCYPTATPPLGAYQVTFPRLELVLDGEYELVFGAKTSEAQHAFLPNQAIFIPANAWNKPMWTKSCQVLSILFGKSQLGFSLIEYHTEQGFTNVVKHALPLPNSSVFEHTLLALEGLQYEHVPNAVFSDLTHVLLTQCTHWLTQPNVQDGRRSERLYRHICLYIQENCHKDLSRTTIGKRFGVSTAHISRLFHQEGHIKYADYVTQIRLDRAKFLLCQYHLKVDEIAQRCGFHDTNYFCRVFKQKTQRTPSQYRTQQTS